MVLERLLLWLEEVGGVPTNKALLHHFFFDLHSHVSHCSESVDDDTENEIKEQHNDHDVEGQIENISSPIKIIVNTKLSKGIADTSSWSDSGIESWSKAESKFLAVSIERCLCTILVSAHISAREGFEGNEGVQIYYSQKED